MQFSIATLAVLATAVMAESTLYVTEEVTITSCAPTVTDCPAQSTVVSMTSYPVITSSAAPVVPEYPVEEHPATSSAVEVYPTAPVVPEYPVEEPTTSVSENHPTTLAPAPSVVTVTVTECPVETPVVPSKPVESKPAEETPVYPTGESPAVPVHPTGSAPAVPQYPTGVTPEAPVYPTGTGVPTVPVHPTGTGAVVPSKTPVFTGAASINTVSALAFAGVIAALFA